MRRSAITSIRVRYSSLSLALALSLMLGVQAESRAIAHDGKSCLSATGRQGDDDYGQIDAGETADSNENGLRSDVRIIDAGNASCQYISSVQINSASGHGAFEFGYIIGCWGPSGCSGVDHDHYYAEPTLFNVRVTDSGSYSCVLFPNDHPSQQTYRNLRVSDLNESP